MATLLLVEKSILETDSPTFMLQESVRYHQSLSSMTESGSIMYSIFPLLSCRGVCGK